MECLTRPDRRTLGAAGEHTARLMIEEAGLRVLECNWRDGRRGELDIIARDETDPACSWTVIVEVRTRALASVDARKVTQLRALTGAWCRQRGRLGSRVRIDVVAITLSAQSLRQWPDVDRADVDVRALGAHAVWLRGVQ